METFLSILAISIIVGTLIWILFFPFPGDKRRRRYDDKLFNASVQNETESEEEVFERLNRAGIKLNYLGQNKDKDK